jgi:hypothetical protein
MDTTKTTPKKLTRRRFLYLTGAALATLLASGDFAEPRTARRKRTLKNQPFKEQLSSMPKIEQTSTERRLLVLGGGGTTALRLQVETMIDLFGASAKGHDVLNDMGNPDVWCTSAGAIMGAGLAANYTLGEIRQMVQSEDFLHGIYNKRVKPKTLLKGNGDYFIPPPNAAQLSMRKKMKGITRDLIVAAYEMVLGADFSAAQKTEFLGHAISHTMPSDRPAAGDIPALKDGQMAGFSESPVEEIYNRTGCHFVFLCEDRISKKTIAITTRKDLPEEITLGDKNIRVAPGDSVSIKNAVCGSANPRPFFDLAVPGGKYELDDGGMTGNNYGGLLAAQLALAEGVPADKISILGMTIGALKKDYQGPYVTKANAVPLYGAMLFDEYLADQLDDRLMELSRLLPDPARQIVNFIPTCSDTNNPFCYCSSMIRDNQTKDQDQKGEMDKLETFVQEYKAGLIPNKPMGGNGSSYGPAKYQEALKAMRQWIGGPLSPLAAPPRQDRTPQAAR